MIDLVVFDMAGTTVKAADQVAPSFVDVLARFGLPVSAEEVDRVRGASKRDAILELLMRYSPEQATQVVVDKLLAEFNADLAGRQQREGVGPEEGAEDLFAWLRARKTKIALTTGFDRESTARVLASLGWSTGVADAVVCSDDVKAGRPAPYLIFHAMELTGAKSVAQVAVVGDTVLDLQSGANAAVAMNVGVLTGAHKREQLEAEPHTHVLASIRDLPGILS